MNSTLPERLARPLEDSTLTSLPPALAVRSSGLTDRGMVRPANEDNFLIAEVARTLWVRQSSLPQPQAQYGGGRGHLLLVADGMGGHHAGEVASALTLASVEGFVLHVLRRFSDVQATDEQAVLKDFQAALRQADARLFEDVVKHPEHVGMGTTLTLAFISGRVLFVVHAGDSRCYLFRGDQLRQLTADHTLVGEMARRGEITAEEARHHSHRHIVTNVLGGGEAGVQVDVGRADLELGDVLLLCSDGLTEMLDDRQVAAVLAAEAEPRSACERLVAEANAVGGRDNVTVIVARFDAA